MIICSYLASIPDVIWSAIIASIITLSGVIFVNWDNTKRLRIQLNHDASEREKERKAELRRDVYLVAAEEMTKAIGYLGSLPQQDPEHLGFEEKLQPFFSSAAKIQVVSNPETSILVSKLLAAYNELLMKLLVKVSPIHSLRSDINIRTIHYDKEQAEISRVLAAMTEYNESTTKEPGRFEALNRTFKFHQEQSEKIASERSHFWDLSHKLTREYIRYYIKEMKQVIEFQIDVMVAIRSELDLKTKREELHQLMNDQLMRAEAQLEETLDKIQET